MQLKFVTALTWKGRHGRIRYARFWSSFNELLLTSPLLWVFRSWFLLPGTQVPMDKGSNSSKTSRKVTLCISMCHYSDFSNSMCLYFSFICLCFCLCHYKQLTGLLPVLLLIIWLILFLLRTILLLRTAGLTGLFIRKLTVALAFVLCDPSYYLHLVTLKTETWPWLRTRWSLEWKKPSSAFW